MEEVARSVGMNKVKKRGWVEVGWTDGGKGGDERTEMRKKSGDDAGLCAKQPVTARVALFLGAQIALGFGLVYSNRCMLNCLCFFCPRILESTLVVTISPSQRTAFNKAILAHKQP